MIHVLDTFSNETAFTVYLGGQIRRKMETTRQLSLASYMSCAMIRIHITTESVNGANIQNTGFSTENTFVDSTLEYSQILIHIKSRRIGYLWKYNSIGSALTAHTTTQCVSVQGQDIHVMDTLFRVPCEQLWNLPLWTGELSHHNSTGYLDYTDTVLNVASVFLRIKTTDLIGTSYIFHTVIHH